MNDFLTGVLVMASVAVAAFFWRYWRKTRDRFFAYFAVAFLLMALNRLALMWVGREHESVAALYGLRLFSFLLILLAIWQKNRAHR